MSRKSKSRKKPCRAAGGQRPLGSKARKREEKTKAEVCRALRAIAADSGCTLKKRTRGLDCAMRHGLTRNEAAALVNRIIGGRLRVGFKEIRVASVG